MIPLKVVRITTRVSAEQAENSQLVRKTSQILNPCPPWLKSLRPAESIWPPIFIDHRRRSVNIESLVALRMFANRYFSVRVRIGVEVWLADKRFPVDWVKSKIKGGNEQPLKVPFGLRLFLILTRRLNISSQTDF